MKAEDSALLTTLRGEFNAQPEYERFRTGRFMTYEAATELLRELQHARATVARIEARIARVLDAERRREPEEHVGVEEAKHDPEKEPRFQPGEET